jgi:hypothetical protein
MALKSHKPKTFYPKAGKQTRSREIPDEKKGSYRSPLTRNPTRHLDFKIQDIPKDIQASKLNKSADKTARHIKKLIERKFREPSNADYIERQILHYEDLYNWKMFRVGMLQKGIQVQEKREATAKENLAREMQGYVKNLEKTKVYPKSVQEKFQVTAKVLPEDVKEKEKMAKQKLVRLGAKKKITSTRYKRFSLK